MAPHGSTHSRTVPPDVEAVLREPNPAVIATVRQGGTPHSAATWYDWEDGRLLVNMDAGRARLRWMKAGAPISLTVLAAEGWSVHVTVVGRVAELRDDPDLVDIDRLSTRYSGEPWSDRASRRVSAWIDVTGWHAWDSGSRRITSSA